MEKSHMLYMLKEVNQFLEMQAKAMLKEDHMSFQEYLILGYLLFEDGGDSYATGIHKKIGLSKAGVSSTLKNLRKKGYLNMEISSRDERIKRITLTEKAYQREAELQSNMEMNAGQLCKNIPEEELAVFGKCLHQMTCNIRQNNEKRRT